MAPLDRVRVCNVGAPRMLIISKTHFSLSASIDNRVNRPTQLELLGAILLRFVTQRL